MDNYFELKETDKTNGIWVWYDEKDKTTQLEVEDQTDLGYTKSIYLSPEQMNKLTEWWMKRKEV